MRLLNTETHRLELCIQSPPPRYAILSHTWRSEELVYDDVIKSDAEQLWKSRACADKVLRACKLARNQHYDYIWIDNCCIDKSSSAELSSAINSMYNWYGAAAICYGFLSDVSDQTHLSNSRWFQRGWTLQELIAPQKFEFYNQSWDYLGTREQLASAIEELTRIPKSLLSERDTDIAREAALYTLYTTSIAKRMSWYGSRQTARGEDMAHCLMGLFGVNMPLLYGEGHDGAFRRLQEEIMRQSGDQSILVHIAPSLLSPNATYFTGDVSIMHRYRKTNISFSDGDLSLDVLLCPCVMGRAYGSGSPTFLAVLNCSLDADAYLGRPALIVQRTSEERNRYRKVEFESGKRLVVLLVGGGVVHYQWQYMTPSKDFMVSWNLNDVTSQRIILELNDCARIPDHCGSGNMIVQLHQCKRRLASYSIVSSTPKLHNDTMIATSNSSFEQAVRVYLDSQQFEWLGVLLLSENSHPNAYYVLSWGWRYEKASNGLRRPAGVPWCKLIDHGALNRSIMSDQPDASIDVVNGIKALTFNPSHMLWHAARHASDKTHMPVLIRGLRRLGSNAGPIATVATKSGMVLSAEMKSVSFLGSTIYELHLEESLHGFMGARARPQRAHTMDL